MMRLFFPVAAFVLICDIITKQIVYRNMDLYQSIPVFGDWFHWTYIHNYGAAFGLFEGNRWVFVAVSILSVFVLFGLARSPRYQRPWTLIALGLILGGAIGNLIDRLWLGKVIDFINIGIGDNRWPYFNIADSGISVGVVLLALQMLREGSPEETSDSENGPNSVSESGRSLPAD